MIDDMLITATLVFLQPRAGCRGEGSEEGKEERGKVPRETEKKG